MNSIKKFSGFLAVIVVATVPDARTDELIASLAPLEQQGLLDISVEIADPASTASPTAMFTVDLVGQDRLGLHLHQVLVPDRLGANQRVGRTDC